MAKKRLFFNIDGKTYYSKEFVILLLLYLSSHKKVSRELLNKLAMDIIKDNVYFYNKIRALRRLFEEDWIYEVTHFTNEDLVLELKKLMND